MKTRISEKSENPKIQYHQHEIKKIKKNKIRKNQKQYQKEEK